MRLATYNVEWMTALFADDGALLLDDAPSARHKTSRAAQLAALGRVFTALNADGVMIIEAPDTSGRRSTVQALENFARHFRLRARKAVSGFVSATEQEIAFLYDPDHMTATHSPQQGPSAPRFDAAITQDINDDGFDERVAFSKPPLELVVQTKRQSLRVIGVHAKSKAPHGKMTQAEFRRISVENRRKQLAECQWLRQRVEAHLQAGDSLILLGDLNDGPGIDQYEQVFGRSGVEVVLGQDAAPALRLTDPHARMALQPGLGLRPTTARFWLAPQERYFEALLDFIMISPDLAAKSPVWRIWHPFNDPKIADTPALRDAVLTASDHFPVTLDM